jgi:hypothetical protein
MNRRAAIAHIAALSVVGCAGQPALAHLGTPKLAITLDEYRDELERHVAEAILQRESMTADALRGMRRLWAGHANGQMNALRLLGGYENTVFDVSWAKAVAAAKGSPTRCKML